MIPKQILLALPLLCLAAIANCQRTTYTVGVNSGYFRYKGDQSVASSSIHALPTLGTQLEGPAGRRSGFSYEVSGNIQRITKSKIIFGAELAWQSLQSKVTINGMIPSMYSSYIKPTSGMAKLTSQYICLTPFVGYRLLNKKVRMDITTGLELGACISRKEDIDATDPDTNENFKGTNDITKRHDLRARLQLNTSMGRFGITTGYSAGLTNYYNNDAFFTARSSFIRLGVNYRIK
jgi:hypothetical protein